MIFVTAGHKEFERLIKKMDSISKDTDREVIMQIGDRPTYIPKNTSYSRFILRKEIDDYFQKAELIISHCSVGVLLKAGKYNKPLIMVPRQYIYREHVDDHQVEFAEMLVEQNNTQGVRFVFDINELGDTIEQVLQDKTAVALKSFGQRNNLIETLKHFVSNLKTQEHI
ncbi:MAG: glycosyltransferase [Planctomycetota bacterium]|jgi:UDP-N-acetylglucosamine transferase subunit ALG13